MKPQHLKYVLVCPAPGIGHLNAMIALSTKLVSFGVAIKFVCPDQEAFAIVSRTPQAAHHEVTCLMKDATPPQKSVFPVKPGFAYLQFADFTMPDYSTQESEFESILQSMVNSGDPPAALIFDSGVPWASAPASNLSIPTFAFSANSGIDVLVDLYASKLFNESLTDEGDQHLDRCIPGCPPLRRYEVQWRVDALGSSFSQYKKKLENQILNSSGLLLNSCGDLDERVVAALDSGVLAQGLEGKVFPVGPLVCNNMEHQLDEKQALLIKWLDNQPSKSVLFISFGSWETICEEQVMELAAGLEASGARFLWVESFENQVAADFKSRMEGRALVHFGFAPQQRILAHASVGGFLTHCGWNSVVECVSLSGVPVIAWGLMLDQPLNAALLVDIGVGVEPEVNGEGIVERSEVERVISLVMGEESGQKLRDRADELKRSIAAHATGKQDHLQLLVNQFSNGKLIPSE